MMGKGITLLLYDRDSEFITMFSTQMYSHVFCTKVELSLKFKAHSHIPTYLPKNFHEMLE
jgi:hypothetical protein